VQVVFWFLQTQNPMMATTIEVPAYHVVPENTQIYPMDGH